MLPSVTLLYAALLGLVGIVLQVFVIRARAAHAISLSDGGHKHLTEAIRRHGNWAETVPFVLVALLALELSGTPTLVLHGLGALLLVGRILHPLGIDFDRGTHPLRLAGMGATITATVSAIGVALYVVLTR